MFNIEHGIDFCLNEEISVAFAACKTKLLKLAAVVDHLEEVIINQYDGTPFETYKSNWISRILEEAQIQPIECVYSKPNWGPITSHIIDDLVANRLPRKDKRKGFAASSALTIATSTTAVTNAGFSFPFVAAAEVVGSSSSTSVIAAVIAISPTYFPPGSPSIVSSVSYFINSKANVLIEVIDERWA
ncbi:hypothetical protein MBANPS3_008349 [Mucor bainieri]